MQGASTDMEKECLPPAYLFKEIRNGLWLFCKTGEDS